MINLQVKRSARLPIDKSILIQAVKTTLENEKAAAESEVSLVIGDDSLLRRLNRKYRQTDAPTDVLSFPSGESDPDTGIPYLGDIIISLPRAQEQASAGGHPLEAELQLLVVHGTLHLLGYDHADGEDKVKMQSAQAKILNKLGIDLDIQL